MNTFSRPPPTDPQPAFNAPWPAPVLVALITVSYLAQSQWSSGDDLVARYAFSPADMDTGRWWTLVTYQFLHGGWAHVAVNAVMALAFGPPVSRLLGEGIAGAAAFFLFYLVCGAAGAGAFAALHLHDHLHQLVGASGGVAGLVGAGARLISRPGRLAPLNDRMVMSFSAVWLVLNMVLGLIGFAPGMGRVSIAWEAHLGGFVVGLLLIGPVARLIARR